MNYDNNIKKLTFAITEGFQVLSTVRTLPASLPVFSDTTQTEQPPTFSMLLRLLDN